MSSSFTSFYAPSPGAYIRTFDYTIRGSRKFPISSDPIKVIPAAEVVVEQEELELDFSVTNNSQYICII